MAKLQYGAGWRDYELAGFRTQDIDFEQRKVGVRGGKGNNDWATFLTGSLGDELRRKLQKNRALFDRDRSEGVAGAGLSRDPLGRENAW